MSLPASCGGFEAWALEISLPCGVFGVQGWGRGDEAAHAAVCFSRLVVPSGGCRVMSDGCWSVPSQKAALL